MSYILPFQEQYQHKEFTSGRNWGFQLLVSLEIKHGNFNNITEAQNLGFQEV
jgi:hypothetical protein